VHTPRRGLKAQSSKADDDPAIEQLTHSYIYKP
jgi:hypothetical protein